MLLPKQRAIVGLLSTRQLINRVIALLFRCAELERRTTRAPRKIESVLPNALDGDADSSLRVPLGDAEASMDSGFPRKDRVTEVGRNGCVLEDSSSVQSALGTAAMDGLSFSVCDGSTVNDYFRPRIGIAHFQFFLFCCTNPSTVQINGCLRCRQR